MAVYERITFLHILQEVRGIGKTRSQLRIIGKSPYGTSYTGTSFDSKLPEVTIAGKTGTAEYGTEGSDGAAAGKLPTHGWFIFWAPHESPRIAGSVFVKRGRGSQEAAKVAREIVKAYFGVV